MIEFTFNSVILQLTLNKIPYMKYKYILSYPKVLTFILKRKCPSQTIKIRKLVWLLNIQVIYILLKTTYSIQTSLTTFFSCYSMLRLSEIHSRSWFTRFGKINKRIWFAATFSRNSCYYWITSSWSVHESNWRLQCMFLSFWRSSTFLSRDVLSFELDKQMGKTKTSWNLLDIIRDGYCYLILVRI